VYVRGGGFVRTPACDDVSRLLGNIVSDSGPEYLGRNTEDAERVKQMRRTILDGHGSKRQISNQDAG
jgi:hypothetical protein